MAFQSQTYGKLNLKKVPEKIMDYVKRMEKYDAPFQVTVGPVSQNFSDTKIVSVIAVTCEGHGGIFFYEVSRINRIADVRLKLTEETTRSLEIMTALVETLESDELASKLDVAEDDLPAINTAPYAFSQDGQFALFKGANNAIGVLDLKKASFAHETNCGDLAAQPAFTPTCNVVCVTGACDV